MWIHATYCQIMFALHIFDKLWCHVVSPVLVRPRHSAIYCASGRSSLSYRSWLQRHAETSTCICSGSGRGTPCRALTVTSFDPPRNWIMYRCTELDGRRACLLWTWARFHLTQFAGSTNVLCVILPHAIALYIRSVLSLCFFVVNLPIDSYWLP